MRTTIRLPFSTDHQKKKLRLIEIPYSFYLQLVCSSRFEHILAKPLKETYQRLKYDFLERNQFLSDDYLEDYQSEKFIHFINHADIHKFFCRLLSLNYQEKRHLLDLPVGSIAEYFASHDFFGNDKYKNWQNITDDTWRHCLFCYAIIQDQYLRHTEKEKLFEKLDRFAKDEIQKRDRQIKSINEQSARQKKKIDTLEEEVLHLQNLLLEEQENKIVLVPSDPLYMLGLTQGQEDKAQSRAKSLLKSLHPDRTQNKDTAFLFDMILKSRDMILKKST